ncbi:MAG: TrbI/VirB10 family protein [Sphingomonas sp.]
MSDAVSEDNRGETPEPVAACVPDPAATPAPGQAATPAHDPGAFRLRAAPPQVTRLSRKALAMAGIAAGAALGGALIYALHERPPATPRNNLYTSQGAARAGIVAEAPADYASVPKLGPPLPGDLGPPIVAARQHDTAAATPKQDSVKAEERQREVQARDAARASALFTDRQTAPATPATASLPPPAGAAHPTPQVVPPPGGQATKRAFLQDSVVADTPSTARLTPLPSPYVLQAGSVIAAALITGIRSDLPGQITAQVTENVYDSPTGRILLIPQGSRLLGRYDSDVSAGDERVLLAWDRLILPDGQSIALEAQPGADAAGMAGLEDRTNHHWGNLFKATVMSTLLGIGTEFATGGSSRLVQALRYGTQDTINQTGRALVERESGLAPTLTIRPGFPVRVIVTRDLILEPEGAPS